MEILRYQFVLEAEQPIAHHAESLGNTAVLMRRKVRLPDGSFANVPTITGDTMRHGIREAGALAYLDAAGILETGGLTEAALRLLFSGGMITGRGDAGAVKLDEYREACELFPLLPILGGCAGNRSIPGKLIVEDAQLVCEENRRWLPAWVVEKMAAEQSVIEGQRSHVEEVQRVRMDPTLRPDMRKLLGSGASKAAEQRLLDGEKASAEGDAVGAADAKSSMMPRRYERIVQGSLFAWTVQATVHSDLERDAFLTALAAFLYQPIVGGKKGTGHGRMRAVDARGLDVARPADRAEVVNPAALAPRTGEMFRAHVAARKDRIATWLAKVDA